MIIRDNFYYFCTKSYIVISYLNRPVETMVTMRNKKNYPSIINKYSPYLELCLVLLPSPSLSLSL